MVTRVSEQLFEAVKRTLRYYALFRYPIGIHEIHRHCELRCSIEEVEDVVNELLQEGAIHCYDGYYAISAEVQSMLARRLAGNESAVATLNLAKYVGAFIYRFPFVRFVGISGSLSKGFITRNGDYDFFIITATDRLWICRTLLHLFKKITFLFGQQHKFCMNYFIDQSAISLEETNVYTATELSSLVPVCGKEDYELLITTNAWVKQALPNLADYSGTGCKPGKHHLVKNGTEWLINRLAPSTVNKTLMNFTDRRWRKKWARVGYPQEDYRLAFKTTLHISKNHPSNYQKRILEELNRKKS